MREPLPAGAVRVLAVGKASVAMTAAAVKRLGDRVVSGLVVAPAPMPRGARWDRLSLIEGNHPVPDAGSEAAGHAALQLMAAGDAASSALVLLSGGASALMAVPARGLSLADKRETTARLLRAGVPIQELNAVRKHLSGVKGGALAASSSVPVLTLAISDVVGDDPAVIGSGPTVPDDSTYADALAVVSRAAGREPFPPAVMARLEAGVRGDLPETPKPGDPRLARSRWTLIGGRGEAMAAAAQEAAVRGYAVEVRERPVVGEARRAADDWMGWLRSERRHRPTCLISSGETTVTVTGAGRGGRNQEFALALVEPLSRMRRAVVVASMGTDGIDGPTDAAGAFVRSDTLSRARQAKLPPPADFLRENDAYAFFALLDDLIRSGPTGTNVGDLQVCLLG